VYFDIVDIELAGSHKATKNQWETPPTPPCQVNQSSLDSLQVLSLNEMVVPLSLSSLTVPW